jgi:hypothetical protein
MGLEAGIAPARYPKAPVRESGKSRSVRTYLLEAQVLLDDEWHAWYYAIGKPAAWIHLRPAEPPCELPPSPLHTPLDRHP